MWEVSERYSNKKYIDGHWIKGTFWWATIEYDKGLIIVDGEADDAHTAVVNAMTKLTRRGKMLFANWAYATKELMPFYWIDDTTFASCGLIYEIEYDGRFIRKMSDQQVIGIQDIPWTKVDWKCTHPIVRVARRMKELKEANNELNKQLFAWENSWVDGPNN